MANKDRILALAGMFQAADLVRQIARKGMTDADYFRHSIESVLKTEAPTTEDVYGGIEGVRHGLTILSQLFERETKERDLEITRYVLGIVHLQRKLMKNQNLMNKLTGGIERAQAQADSFDGTHENVIANLADTYAETISTLQPRIVVSGEQGHLSNEHNANKVRALLLAVMRSAFLWKQKGGARWHLIFSRGKILKDAREVLRAM